MTSYPVYDCTLPDYTRDIEPIGHASSEAEALAILAGHFDPADAPRAVELNDRDTMGGSLWAYWPVYE